MDAEFWHQRWQNNKIGFHEGEANGLLTEHFCNEFGTRGGRVFLPLCGKTRDIGWLVSQGFQVVGAELSEPAIEQLFADLDVSPEIVDLGSLTHYSSSGIDIFVGDIFNLSAKSLGPVDVIYDRAALVALPEKMRATYATHLMHITETALQFLISFEYDQTKMDGPPFSLAGEKIDQYYGERYVLSRVASVDVPGGLKGKCAATEHAWLLRTE